MISTPISRTFSDCCARAAIGHAAAPPSSVMNARRCMSSPKVRRRHPNASNEYFDRAQTGHQNHCRSAQPMSLMGQSPRFRCAPKIAPMSAILRSRPNLRTAANRRGVPYALKSMDAVRAKLKQAILYIERNPKLVRSISSFPYIVNSL
jgi:hypothetical protein